MSKINLPTGDLGLEIDTEIGKVIILGVLPRIGQDDFLIVKQEDTLYYLAATGDIMIVNGHLMPIRE